MPNDSWKARCHRGKARLVSNKSRYLPGSSGYLPASMRDRGRGMAESAKNEVQVVFAVAWRTQCMRVKGVYSSRFPLPPESFGVGVFVAPITAPVCLILALILTLTLPPSKHSTDPPSSSLLTPSLFPPHPLLPSSHSSHPHPHTSHLRVAFRTIRHCAWFVCAMVTTAMSESSASSASTTGADVDTKQDGA